MNFTHMLAALLLSVCLGVLPITAEAVTFTVNSTVDDVDIAPGDGLCATVDGVCTLRAAIQEANAFAGTDTIVLKPKKYYLTIPGIEEASATGDLDITDDLTIKGVSSARTIINGGSLDRVFEIIGPVTVKFVNLSIQNGFVQNFGGGGILNWGGIVFLTSCSVANNVVSGSGELLGGGIFSSGVGSSLTIESSSVINNAVISSTPSALGGGIAVTDYDGGTLRISASTISYNSVTSAAGYVGGGGIFSDSGGKVTITNSKVLSNSAISFSGNGYCGGIALDGDNRTAVIKKTSINNNSSTSSGGIAYGGGLCFEDERVTISSCTIKGNRANAPAPNGLGGGIYAMYFSNVTINNASTIVSNLASFDGGGVKKDSESTITVSLDSTIANNMPNN